ncbi:hypothetical protein FKP32DRAFT_825832 [Trametes sanguinea]|nr:hypothetical protein FKP32DRAFT_825832 [Trametes sanguinea]
MDPQTSIEHLLPVEHRVQPTSTESAEVRPDNTTVTDPPHPFFDWTLPLGELSPAVAEGLPPPPALPLDQVLALAQAVSDQISASGNNALDRTHLSPLPSGQEASTPAPTTRPEESTTASLPLNDPFWDLLSGPLVTNSEVQPTPAASWNPPGPVDISPLLGIQDHSPTPPNTESPSPVSVDNALVNNDALKSRSGPSRAPRRTRGTARQAPYSTPSPSASSSPDSASSDTSLDEYRCPHCSYVQRARRRVDLERHMALHAPSRARRRYPCCGIPLALVPSLAGGGSKVSTVRCALPGEDKRWVELEMVGGCGGVFSRADALKRHLDEKCCLGDHRGPWLRGVWEAMCADDLEGRIGAS